jgi:integrase
MVVKIDPYKHKQQYIKWREKIGNKIPGISEKNSQMILDYLYDMENGLNIAKGSKKGARSYNRLNNIRQRLVFLTKKFKELYDLDDLTQISERQIHKFFTDMRNGAIKRIDGGIYRDPVNFVKILKSFWHWHQKINRKNGIEISDITADLDTHKEKPRWVYLTEEEIRKIYDEANKKYKVLIMFLLDTGIRAPGELINIKVSDFYNDFRELMIRDEISKTFGRKIKLMISSDLVKRYIESQGFKENDRPFLGNHQNMNRVLKRLGKKVFGDKISPAGENYSNLTMYDFRHCSCCYWLPRYKSESALKL